MWPYKTKRVALLKEFMIQHSERNEWGQVRIPEPSSLYDEELLPHLKSVIPFEDYESAKYRVAEILKVNDVERRLDWEQRNTKQFHWCGAVIEDDLVVVFQLNYEPVRGT